MNTLLKARNYCFLLLKYRMRSENEIRQRLIGKEFDQAVIEKTVSFLKDKRFIDDQEFARLWLESRLRKPYGLRRIKLELRKKGVPAQIISAAVLDAGAGESEESVVRALAKEKFEKSSRGEPEAAKRRIYGYLLRRGFAPEMVNEVMQDL